MRNPLSKEDLRRRKEAIDNGKGTYTREDGQVWRIRNRNNPRLKRRFGGQGGTDEVASTRDRNRDSKTRLGVSRRARNERVSTPRVKNRKKQTADYEKAKQEAKAAGKDHHHKTPVYLTGNAKAQMDRRSRRRYDLRMQRAGTSQGNTAENVSAETRGPKGTHRQAHKEGEAVQSRLKEMEAKNISPSLNRRSRRAQLASNRPEVPTAVQNVGSLIDKARTFSTKASGLSKPRPKPRLGAPIKIPTKLGLLAPGGLVRGVVKEVAEEAINEVGMNLSTQIGQRLGGNFNASSNTPTRPRRRS
jgi:hypothetical protein